METETFNLAFLPLFSPGSFLKSPTQHSLPEKVNNQMSQSSLIFVHFNKNYRFLDSSINAQFICQNFYYLAIRFKTFQIFFEALVLLIYYHGQDSV